MQEFDKKQLAKIAQQREYLRRREMLLDDKILAIQKSTKTTFNLFNAFHNKLRAKWKWYYRWHLSPFSNFVHFAIIILSCGYLSFYTIDNLGGGVKRAYAATCASLQDGDWTVSTTWDTACGGIPQPADNVSISSGTIVTVTADASVSSITVNGTGVLRINEGKTLTTSSTAVVTIAPADDGVIQGGEISGAGTLILPDGAGALLGTTGTLSSKVRFDTATTNVVIPARTYGGNVEIYNGTVTNHDATLGKQAGEMINFGSDFIGNASSTGALTLKADTKNPNIIIMGNFTTTRIDTRSYVHVALGSGTWTAYGNWTNINGTVSQYGNGSANDAGKVVLIGNGKTITSPVANQRFYDLQISGNTFSTIVGSENTVSHKLIVDSGVTLTLSSGTIGVANLITINGAIDGAGTLLFYYANGDNLGTSGTLRCTVKFNLNTSSDNIPARNYDGPVIISNSLTSDSTETFGTGSPSQPINFNAGLTISTVSSGILTLTAATYNPTINITGNLTTSKASTGVINLNMGASTWTISGNANLNGSTVTAGSATINVNGSVANNASGIINAGTSTWNVGDNINADNWTIGGIFNKGTTSTVHLKGTGDLTAGVGSTYYNLNAAADGKTTNVIVDPLNISGVLALGNNSSIFTSNQIVTLVGSGTPFDPHSATITLSQGMEYVNNTARIASTNYGGSLSARCNINCLLDGDITTTSLKIAGSSTDGIATLDTNGYSIQASSLTLDLGAGSRFYGVIQNGSGTISNINVSNNVTNYFGAVADKNKILSDKTVWTVGGDFINNDFVTAGSGPTNSGTFNIAGSVNNTGTINAGYSTWNMGASGAGNWTNTGAFVPETSIVNFSGISESTLSGDTTFNDLNMTSGVAKTIQFTGGSTTIVNGTWTVAGSDGNLITLTSDSTTPWNIDPASAFVSYANVSYSNNNGPQITPTNSTDGGHNNSGWNFGTPPPADSTPPVLSNGLPTGMIGSGTTSTTIGVTTDENATCKYSTTGGVAYGNMTNDFIGTETTHTALVSGLTNGNTFSYFVRCQDTVLSPNVNTNDYTISLAVATPSSTNNITPADNNTSVSNSASSNTNATTGSTRRISSSVVISTRPTTQTTVTTFKEPANLIGEFFETRKEIVLKWDKSTMTDIDGYRIYRSEEKDKAYEIIGSTDNATFAYTDFNVASMKTYYYYVASYKADKDLGNSDTIMIALPKLAEAGNGAYSTTKKPINWVLIGLEVIAGALIITLVIYRLIRLKKSAIRRPIVEPLSQQFPPNPVQILQTDDPLVAPMSTQPPTQMEVTPQPEAHELKPEGGVNELLDSSKQKEKVNQSEPEQSNSQMDSDGNEHRNES